MPWLPSRLGERVLRRGRRLLDALHIGRRFALVTLLGPSAADNHIHRDTLLHYRDFGRRFQLFDIRNYDRRKNNANVTIIDRFALTVALLEGARFEDIEERLSGTEGLVFMTSDLHHWAIFPQHTAPDILSVERLTPAMSRTEPLFQLFDRLDIDHLITSYDCPELWQIQSERPSLHTYVVNLHFDESVFKDYALPKKYDVIIYGNLWPAGYPFRSRVARLLIESGRFNILRIETNRPHYDPENCGQGLARKINQSWLGLATGEDFQYLVSRYFEIPASGSVVLGDMNAQGRAIFLDRYIHIDDQMTDQTILDIVSEALTHRDRLRRYAREMHDVMHARYTLADHERKLFEVAREIHRSSSGQR